MDTHTKFLSCLLSCPILCAATPCTPPQHAVRHLLQSSLYECACRVYTACTGSSAPGRGVSTELPWANSSSRGSSDLGVIKEELLQLNRARQQDVMRQRSSMVNPQALEIGSNSAKRETVSSSSLVLARVSFKIHPWCLTIAGSCCKALCLMVLWAFASFVINRTDVSKNLIMQEPWPLQPPASQSHAVKFCKL